MELYCLAEGTDKAANNFVQHPLMREPMNRSTARAIAGGVHEGGTGLSGLECCALGREAAAEFVLDPLLNDLSNISERTNALAAESHPQITLSL